ncbi:MAG: DUF2917 domain-containing protein [Methylotenera sp.]|jgi:hypothetical protein|nr:DUF2917 domain-containing protein [Methylotenera sp.]
MPDQFLTCLAPGQALTLAPARLPRRLVVTQGRLWLTVTGHTSDHWLQAGDGLTLAPGEAAVVEAWPQAAFQLLQPVPQPGARRSGWRRPHFSTWPACRPAGC